MEFHTNARSQTKSVSLMISRTVSPVALDQFVVAPRADAIVVAVVVVVLLLMLPMRGRFR
jgi:hypothetical protein